MKGILLLLALVSVAVSSNYREYLKHYLHDFEELAKDRVYLEHVSNFTVLSAMRIYVKIELQNKVFHASLQPHTSLFHPELVVKHKFKGGEKLGSVNVEEFFEGSLVDEPSSRVLVHIKDNIVTGTIQVSDHEKYFIEPSKKHIKEPHDFHMISYKLSDVKFNFTNPEKDNGHFCGHESHEGQTGFSVQKDFEFMIPKTPFKEDGFEYSRKKRDSVKKTQCPLALIADNKFFKLHKEDEGDTINFMIGLVQQVDALYRRQSLDPNDSEEYKDHGFQVKYVEVINEPDLVDTESYRYAGPENYQRRVSDLLKNFAFGEWRPDYCLAHLFTNYDFAGGVLGLAYVGTKANNRVGGICTQIYRDPITKRLKSLNVGLTTGTNYDRPLLSSELLFVTGHEFGHNWGSSHDSDTSKECAPSGDRYMMYPAAVDGSQPNNYVFSPCSKRAINDVLRAKTDVCFEEAFGAVCGNGIVEDGEDCDQGTTKSDCCENCKFTADSECEPVNDRCCGNQCKYEDGKKCLDTNAEKDNNVHCYEDFTCKMNTTSSKYECMPGDELDRGDVCFDNGRCEDGKCKNLCEYYGKVPCACTDEENICKHCCKEATPGSECKEFANPDTGNVDNLSDGKICGNGHCEFGVCVIGPQDLQEKFWDVIDRLDVNMVLKWFRDNIVFAIVLFSSIIWIPVSCFVDWLDDKYDLGYVDEMLGSDDNDQKLKAKRSAGGGTMLLQEKKSISDKKPKHATEPQYLYPKLDDTGV